MTTPPPSPATQFLLRPHPHLYEINTWAWLEKLSVRLGRLIKLADVPDAEWDAIAQRGFDIVWLMGVWGHSAEARRIELADPANRPLFDRVLPGWTPEDVIGSPYSIAQYVPDPRIGTWDSLDRVREKLRARGMALFLDFVGNHTALDHPWTREHPEYYVQGTQEDFQKDPASFHRIDTPKGPVFLALGKDPYFPPWDDVAQLNHFSPGMRAALLAELQTIAAHCDGMRCDMAMLQFNDIFERVWNHRLQGADSPHTEFWHDAHAAVPGLILLAEAYWDTEQRLLDLGFSFVYDKGLYDAVRYQNFTELHARLAEGVGYQRHLARFLENHDEDRCATAFGPERLASVGTLMGTLPGMRFYQEGEIEGAKTHLPIALRRIAAEPPDPASAAFFEKILRITEADVFHNGRWNLLPVNPEGDDTSSHFVIYEWRSEKSWKVISVNLAGSASQGRVQFGDRPLPAKEYAFYDELNDVRYVRSADELHSPGLFVRREAFEAHLFDVSPV
ncbi:MAG TPA: alpha-amylase family glycosyl hydrolase [Candidatus Acidoferrales bacterium]|nr:alpha-amylase family glycosyl hydrolase [Candidatus Acidoferrales bacterium]